MEKKGVRVYKESRMKKYRVKVESGVRKQLNREKIVATNSQPGQDDILH